MDFKKLAAQYKSELLDSVLPFWLEKSQDKEFGGYFTCLDRDGSVFDTDKFVWLQGREVWMFAMLYNKVEKKQEWLDCAIQGGEFLKKYAHDGNYDFYFSVTREGKPIIQPYNIFSNTFACMAFAQLAEATGSEEYKEIALKTFQRILDRRNDPKGRWEKSYPGTRPMKGFALPMIICNMALEVENILPDKTMLDQTIDECLSEILNVFYHPELGVMLENVSPDGTPIDCFEGREINPGHDLEALWFMMNLGIRRNDKALIDKCVEIALSVIDFGWDKEYGGIFYFQDIKKAPMQKLEWDQKLWWVHRYYLGGIPPVVGHHLGAVAPILRRCLGGGNHLGLILPAAGRGEGCVLSIGFPHERNDFLGKVLDGTGHGRAGAGLGDGLLQIGVLGLTGLREFTGCHGHHLLFVI